MEINGGTTQRSDTYTLSLEDPFCTFSLNAGEKLIVSVDQGQAGLPFKAAPSYYPFHDAPIGCMCWAGVEEPDKRGLLTSPWTFDGPGKIWLFMNIYQEREVPRSVINFTVVEAPNPL